MMKMITELLEKFYAFWAFLRPCSQWIWFYTQNSVKEELHASWSEIPNEIQRLNCQRNRSQYKYLANQCYQEKKFCNTSFVRKCWDQFVNILLLIF